MIAKSPRALVPAVAAHRAVRSRVVSARQAIVGGRFVGRFVVVGAAAVVARQGRRLGRGRRRRRPNAEDVQSRGGAQGGDEELERRRRRRRRRARELQRRGRRRARARRALDAVVVVARTAARSGSILRVGRRRRLVRIRFVQPVRGIGRGLFSARTRRVGLRVAAAGAPAASEGAVPGEADERLRRRRRDRRGRRVAEAEG